MENLIEVLSHEIGVKEVKGREGKANQQIRFTYLARPNGFDKTESKGHL